MIHAVLTNGQVYPNPISKVVCVGRNYIAHALELNNPVPEAPLLFIKPNSAVVPISGMVAIPTHRGHVHYEAELAVLIGKPLSHATEEEVESAIAGLGLALDLTLRDLQSELKAKGHPWEIAKSFDASCPLTVFEPFENQDLENLSFELEINGELKQQGYSGNMITSIKSLLAFASKHFSLLPGDILLTGTPEGVGVLNPGDNLSLKGLEGVNSGCKVVVNT